VSARFILSFDCEGKWGSADCLTDGHRRDLTDQKLRDAYRAILTLLDEYGVEATFAFAGAFSQSPSAFRRLLPDVEVLEKRAPAYLGPALRDIEETSGDGWHGGELVEAVAASGTPHEIALHGVTHVPWTQMDDRFVEDEMRLYQQLEGPVRNSRTFVYPRNLIAHTAVLSEHGFLGFRNARSERSRFRSLLSELNLFAQPDFPGPDDKPIAIPAGYFLNWRSGARRLVPPAVTQLRARLLLQRAAATGAAVHYWLHPENIATAPATLDLLKSLIREVARRGDAGDCSVLTQLDYCRSLKLRP